MNIYNRIIMNDNKNKDFMEQMNTNGSQQWNIIALAQEKVYATLNNLRSNSRSILTKLCRKHYHNLIEIIL